MKKFLSTPLKATYDREISTSRGDAGYGENGEGIPRRFGEGRQIEGD